MTVTLLGRVPVSGVGIGTGAGVGSVPVPPDAQGTTAARSR